MLSALQLSPYYCLVFLETLTRDWTRAANIYVGQFKVGSPAAQWAAGLKRAFHH